MNTDKKLEEVVNFQVEREKFAVKEKKQKRILRMTEQKVRVLALDRISGRAGDC